jgi:hypothetical protein
MYSPEQHGLNCSYADKAKEYKQESSIIYLYSDGNHGRTTQVLVPDGYSGYEKEFNKKVEWCCDKKVVSCIRAADLMQSDVLIVALNASRPHHEFKIDMDYTAFNFKGDESNRNDLEFIHGLHKDGQYYSTVILPQAFKQYYSIKYGDIDSDEYIFVHEAILKLNNIKLIIQDDRPDHEKLQQIVELSSYVSLVKDSEKLVKVTEYPLLGTFFGDDATIPPCIQYSTATLSAYSAKTKSISLPMDHQKYWCVCWKCMYKRCNHDHDALYRQVLRPLLRASGPRLYSPFQCINGEQCFYLPRGKCMFQHTYSDIKCLYNRVYMQHNSKILQMANDHTITHTCP